MDIAPILIFISSIFYIFLFILYEKYRYLISKIGKLILIFHRSSPQRISKPSCAPPPPPSVSRPTTAPPPPPPTATSRSRPPAPPAPPTRDPLTRISTAVDVNVSLEELTADTYNDNVDTDPILEKITNNSTDLVNMNYAI